MCPHIYIVLPSYMVMAFIGGLISLIIMYLQYEKYCEDFKEFIKLVIVCVLGVFFGSKVLFIVTRIPKFIENMSFENFINIVVQSGFVFYGGLIGVIIGVKILTVRDIKKREKYYYALAPVIPLFHMFGRIGCFMAGCCYGKIIENTVIVFGYEINRIPVQLIEAIYEFILFIILSFISKREIDKDLLKIYLISYSIFRFVIEFFRGDEIRGIWFALSTSQWISVFIIGYYMCNNVKKIINSKRNVRGYNNGW